MENTVSTLRDATARNAISRGFLNTESRQHKFLPNYQNSPSAFLSERASAPSNTVCFAQGANIHTPFRYEFHRQPPLVCRCRVCALVRVSRLLTSPSFCFLVPLARHGFFEHSSKESAHRLMAKLSTSSERTGQFSMSYCLEVHPDLHRPRASRID